MSDLLRRILPLLLAGGIAAAQTLDRNAKAVILVHVTTLLVDADGEVHPVEWPSSNEAALVSQRPDGGAGGRSTTVYLDPRGDARLEYQLHYRPTEHGAYHLKLMRTLNRAGKEESLPPMEHDLDPLSCWSVTLIEDAGQGQRLVLQVIPWIEQATDDVTLDSKRFLMHVAGGVLIKDPGTSRPGAAVVFDNLGCEGRGLDFGIRGVGRVKLAPRPFPGAEPCGWVRGRRMSFSLGGHEYSLLSEELILPVDPDRPGRGWTLYGKLEADPKQKFGHYGEMRDSELP